MSEPDLEPPASPGGSGDDGFDDDFGDFDEAPTMAPPEQHPYNDMKPLTAAEIEPGIENKLREIFPRPSDGESERLLTLPETETSQALWYRLLETPPAYMPRWQGSRIHKKLAVSLGVPLNLDESLPRVERKPMELPSNNEVGDFARLRLLTHVSGEALDGMQEDELSVHISQLEQAITAAEALRDEAEDQESDLLGEKHVLEGMVESLLAYHQRNEREALQKELKRKKGIR